MILALSDPAQYAAWATAAAAIIPGVLAYRRGRKTDDRTSDLDTLREIVHTLQEENGDQRTRITQISGRLDACELEKNELKSKVFTLQLEVFKLKAASSG